LKQQPKRAGRLQKIAFAEQHATVFCAGVAAKIL
jgi:hypothetical protein